MNIEKKSEDLIITDGQAEDRNGVPNRMTISTGFGVTSVGGQPAISASNPNAILSVNDRPMFWITRADAKVLAHLLTAFAETGDLVDPKYLYEYAPKVVEVKSMVAEAMALLADGSKIEESISVVDDLIGKVKSMVAEARALLVDGSEVEASTSAADKLILDDCLKDIDDSIAEVSSRIEALRKTSR